MLHIWLRLFNSAYLTIDSRLAVCTLIPSKNALVMTLQHVETGQPGFQACIKTP